MDHVLGSRLILKCHEFVIKFHSVPSFIALKLESFCAETYVTYHLESFCAKTYVTYHLRSESFIALKSELICAET